MMSRRSSTAMIAPKLCSFCGGGESDETPIVSGPQIFICEQCAHDARSVLEGGPVSATGTAIGSVSAVDAASRCGFCGSRRGQVDGMAEAPSRPAAGKLRERRPGVRICAGCVDVCGEILAGRLS